MAVFPRSRRPVEKVKSLYDYRREFRNMDPVVLAAVIACAQNVQRQQKDKPPPTVNVKDTGPW